MRILFCLLLMLPVFCTGQTITTVAGGGSGGLGDGGPATGATFGGAIQGFAVDRSGNLIIADWWNNRLRRVDAIMGTITTIAGTGTGGYNGDSIMATVAMIYGPSFVATDTAGNIYFSESQNQRIRVIRTDGKIYTYAGNGYGAGFTGSSGVFSGDNGPATDAEFDGPQGISFDSHGNLFVSDANNHRIRMIDGVTHMITTIAGDGTSSGIGDDVPATNTGLAYVYDIANDQYDELYIADIGDGAKKVRYIDPGIHYIHSMAGTGTSLYNGDGMTADSANISPFSMTKSKLNVLYIADYGNNRIRAVQGEFNIISTFAGTGFATFSGDNGPATAACMFEPAHLEMDTCGSLYFADASNQRIRKISFDTSCHFGLTGLAATAVKNEIKLYPNPANELLTVWGLRTDCKITICNILGALVAEYQVQGGDVSLNLKGLENGMYLVKIVYDDIRSAGVYRFLKSE